MNKIKFLPLINTVLIIGLALVYIFNSVDKKETIVYVDNVKLFNEFNMTKEIRAVEEKKMAAKKKTIDSLFNKYQTIEDKESQASKKLEVQISYINKELQDIQNNYANDLTQKVWSRLNAYLKNYGEDKELTFIMGSNGNGNVMFSKTSNDATEAIIFYVNQKYEGYNLQ
nr:OmpH family outer membrane protein [uncultured Psychroserpens sp.]